MTTPLPHDHYDRVSRIPGRARPAKAPADARVLRGFVSYDGKLAEGRRMILAAIIHATSMGLKLHSINMLESDEKNEASLRYTVEGDETALAIFTEALKAI